MLEAVDAFHLQPLFEVGVDGADALEVIATFDRLPDDRLRRNQRHERSGFLGDMRLFVFRFFGFRLLDFDVFVLWFFVFDNLVVINVDAFFVTIFDAVFDLLVDDVFRLIVAFFDDAQRLSGLGLLQRFRLGGWLGRRPARERTYRRGGSGLGGGDRGCGR